MIFGTFCFAMTIHVFLMYPETAKKTLEEIDLVFDQNVPAWRGTHSEDVFEKKVAEVERAGGAGEGGRKHSTGHQEHV